MVSKPPQKSANATKSTATARGLGRGLSTLLGNSGIALSLVEPGPILSSFRKNAYESLHKKIHIEDHFYNDYKKILKLKLGSSQRNTTFTLDPKYVAEKVFHALTSDRPKRRYLVTQPARAGSLMARILPDFAIDYFMKKSVNF